MMEVMMIDSTVTLYKVIEFWFSFGGGLFTLMFYLLPVLMLLTVIFVMNKSGVRRLAKVLTLAVSLWCFCLTNVFDLFGTGRAGFSLGGYLESFTWSAERAVVPLVSDGTQVLFLIFLYGLIFLSVGVACFMVLMLQKKTSLKLSQNKPFFIVVGGMIAASLLIRIPVSAGYWYTCWNYMAYLVMFAAAAGAWLVYRWLVIRKVSAI